MLTENSPSPPPLNLNPGEPARARGLKETVNFSFPSSVSPKQLI